LADLLVVTEKVNNQKLLYFPPQQSSVSAVPVESEKANQSIASKVDEQRYSF